MELGRQLILELYDCERVHLDDVAFLEASLRTAATEMGATILSSNFHPFSPIGVSGVVLIKESHLTIHTWPEYGYAAVDIFTCGAMEMDLGAAYLVAALGAKKSSVQLLHRGLLPNQTTLAKRCPPSFMREGYGEAAAQQMDKTGGTTGAG